MADTEGTLVFRHHPNNSNVSSVGQKIILNIPQKPLETSQEVPNYLNSTINKATTDPPDEANASPVHKSLLSKFALLQAKCKAMSDHSAPAPTFLEFNNLPKELRLMIWRCAGDEGQVIGIKTTIVRGKVELNGTKARCALLLVCKESREEVLKSKENIGSHSAAGGPSIYVNLEVDTV